MNDKISYPENVKFPHWVKSDYQYPPINKMVLVCTNSGGVSITWVSNPGNELFTDGYYTHWMEFPKPPELDCE